VNNVVKILPFVKVVKERLSNAEILRGITEESQRNHRGITEESQSCTEIKLQSLLKLMMKYVRWALPIIS
jgi:hypothetical protein